MSAAMQRPNTAANILSAATSFQWTAETLQARLEEAGACLFALPVHGIRPAGYGSGWPAIMQEALEEVAEAKGFSAAIYRAPAPTGEMIERMDEVDGWINAHVPDVLERRIIRARSFVNPRTGEPVLSWRKLAKALDRNDSGLKYTYDAAIKRLVIKLNAVPAIPAPVVV